MLSLDKSVNLFLLLFLFLFWILVNFLKDKSFELIDEFAVFSIVLFTVIAKGIKGVFLSEFNCNLDSNNSLFNWRLLTFLSLTIFDIDIAFDILYILYNLIYL